MDDRETAAWDTIVRYARPGGSAVSTTDRRWVAKACEVVKACMKQRELQFLSECDASRPVVEISEAPCRMSSAKYAFRQVWRAVHMSSTTRDSTVQMPCRRRTRPHVAARIPIGPDRRAARIELQQSWRWREPGQRHAGRWGRCGLAGGRRRPGARVAHGARRV